MATAKEVQIGSAVAVTLGIAILVYIIWKTTKKTKTKGSETKSENEQTISIPSASESSTDESKQMQVAVLPKMEMEIKKPLPMVPVLSQSESVPDEKKDNDKSESNGENESFVKVEKPSEIEIEVAEAVGTKSENLQKMVEPAALNAKPAEKSDVSDVIQLPDSQHDISSSESTLIESSASFVETGQEMISSTATEFTDITEEKLTDPASQEPKTEQISSSLKSDDSIVPVFEEKEDVTAFDIGAGEAPTDIANLDNESPSFLSKENGGGAGDAVHESLNMSEADMSSASFSIISMPPSIDQNINSASSLATSENSIVSAGESDPGPKEPKTEDTYLDDDKNAKTVPEIIPHDESYDTSKVADSPEREAKDTKQLSHTSKEEIKSAETQEAPISKSDGEYATVKRASDEKSKGDSDVKQPSKTETKLDTEVITKAIQQTQNVTGSIDNNTIRILVDLLQVKDEKLLQTALDCIVRCAAFSDNQKALRENGCPSEMLRLLQFYKSVASGDNSFDSFLVSVNNAIMNLSMDVLNQQQLQNCIPVLIDLVTSEGVSSTVQLSCLQPLTNLATTSDYHGEYTRAIQQLYLLLDSGNRAIRLQALKLLVNLSCNADMVKNLLAAKAPDCLLELLDKTADSSLTLRMTTFLANVVTTVSQEDMTSESLPTGDKAASPETMFTALFGVDNIGKFKNKVYALTRHDSEDIAQQAARLYSALPK